MAHFEADPSMYANMPLASPPKGKVPDFDSPASAAHIAWALDTTSLVLCLMTVAIRLYVKRFVSKQKLTWDDGSCVAALVSLRVKEPIYWKLKSCT